MPSFSCAKVFAPPAPQSRRPHKQPLKKQIPINHLAAEDLVRVDGATVSATTFSEFVRALYNREEFPQVTNHWAKVQESRKVTKASV